MGAGTVIVGMFILIVFGMLSFVPITVETLFTGIIRVFGGIFLDF
jgi:hypothetical protein